MSPKAKRTTIKRPAVKRLDEWLVKQGHFNSLKEAAIACQLGQVRRVPSGELLDKPGFSVPKFLSVEILGESRYVGRGAEKLEALLDQLDWNIESTVALDVGSSTGGFADCLLQRGASQVICVDVGSHQLHEKLRSDSRVQVFEQQDIRSLDFSKLKRRPTLVSVDVSFISLRAILPTLIRNLPDARYILLFKPQFELDRYVPKKRGVAPQKEAEAALKEMLQFLNSIGLYQSMVKPSAVKGTKGNQETFIVAEAGVPQHIFRTYDIRGVADRELTNDVIARIGRALGKRIFKSLGSGARIGVGADARISSPRIHDCFCRALSAEKVNVIDMGSITTPMAYFAHYNFELDGVVQITASHNPKDDNGMKMMLSKNTLFGEEIISLGKEAAELPSADLAPAQKFSSIFKELRQKYISYLHDQFKFSKKYKLALDTGNGMAGSVAREVFSPYASEIDILYEDVDCRFPNHEADPTVPANLKDLQAKVKSMKADMGFAFDGDGDRLGLISGKGRILWGDEIVMLLSELVLKEQPGATIIGEVKCSEKLFRTIEARGGKPLMYKTGHSLIKKKMKEVHAPIAGEMSGHLFFADHYFGFDDSIYGALRVLQVVDQFNLNLDDWIAQFPSSFVTPEIRVSCQESEKEPLVTQVKKFFGKMKGAKLSEIDGVRVSFDDHSWVLVRASNTQAVLVLRIEAISQARLEEIRLLVSESLGRDIRV